jgi:hypothetical protein
MALDPRDPRVQRLLRERELVAESETRAEEKRLAKRAKIAEAFGLSEEEKQDYIAKEFPSLRTKINESSITPQSMASETTPSPAATLSAMKDTATLPAAAEPIGIGPFASGERYGSLLDSLKGKETKAAVGSIKKPTVPVVDEEKPKTPAPSPYETEMTRLKEERATAKEERQTELDRLAKGELASLIGRSLTQIGAAASGMQKGIDMSGVAQKELVDWDKKREQIYNSYTQNIKELDTQQAALSRQAERTEDRAEREAARTAAESLARDKMKLEDSRAKKVAELKQAMDVVKAMGSRDKEAKGKAIKEAEYNLTRYQKEDVELGKLEGLLSEYDIAKDKKKLEGPIEKAAAAVLGQANIPKKQGWFSESTDKEKLLKDIQAKRAEINTGIDFQNKIRFGVGQEVPVESTTTSVPAEVSATAQDEQARKEARRQELIKKARGQ